MTKLRVLRPGYQPCDRTPGSRSERESRKSIGHSKHRSTAMSGLAGRNSETRAIVTGGAQGIGFAVAEALADEGCRALALIGRSQEKGDKAVAALKKNGVDAIFISADVANVADCKRAVEIAIKQFGTLNALVNAAATSARGSLVETSEELFDQIVDTNVRGPFFLMQGLVTHLLERKAPGSIVNVDRKSVV